MKKTISYVILFMLVIQTLSLTIRTGKVSAAPSGTPGDPYIILTPKDLSDIRNDLSASYKLGKDIDLAGYDFDGAGPDNGGWMPIGSSTSFFKGTLDGNGYVIRNMKIDRPSFGHVGLFYGINPPALVTGIRLLDVDVTGWQYAGGLTGSNGCAGSTIKNSYVTGVVNAAVAGSFSVGGLAGINCGTIQSSYADVRVSGGREVGGLVGHLINGGIIQDSYAKGSVSGTDKVGGLVGDSSGSTIKNSYATGNVSGTGAIGGLVGNVSFSSTITDSYWNMQTSGLLTSAAGTGKTTAEMNSRSTYSGLDFTDVWGIREGATYPYLLAFKPRLAADPLAATMYNLTPGQDELSVTGTVYDDSIGERLKVDYTIRDSSNTTVTTVTYSVYADGSAQSIGRTIPLTGLGSGMYTLQITAEDTYNPAVAAPPRAFTVDAAPPSVAFGTNGSESWANSASTTVTVSDSLNGIDASSLKYAWTIDATTPASGWTSFASGSTLSKSGADGDWYLHVQAKDAVGNLANVASNRFRLNTSSAKLSGLTLSAGTLNAAVSGATYNYTASVGSGITRITVTPATADVSDSIAISVNGGSPQTVASGTTSGQLAINVGANTIALVVTALNGTHHTYTVTVTREAPPSDSSTYEPVQKPSNSPSPPTKEPDTVSKPELVADPAGGVKLIVDPSAIEKVTRPDGTVVETVNLDDRSLDQALALLKDAATPILTIEVNDTEKAVQVALPASWVALASKSVPNAVIEVALNGSSFQLVIDVLDLEHLAARLGVQLKDLKVNVITEQVGGQAKVELDQTVSAQGGKVIGNAVDYKVTVAAANGQLAEVRDFGGTYMARAIVLDANRTNNHLTGVLYDPVERTISFVPSVFAARADGKREIAMSAPHNSIYAIMEAGDKTFADLSGHWAKADVELLAAKLIVQGVSDSRFEPDADITRAEFTALLVRALGVSLNPNMTDAGFADVAANAWYAPAVQAAVAAGLVDGMEPGRFAPNDRITREQMAVMIAGALTVAGKQSEAAQPESPGQAAFADRASISAWAQTSVARTAAAGIVEGMPDGTFEPLAYANRAQAAVMLKRFLQHVRFID